MGIIDGIVFLRPSGHLGIRLGIEDFPSS